MSRIMLLSVVAILAAAKPALAKPGPRVVKMTLHPAGPPTPAMKYNLLPQVRDLREGNGAVNYQRSHSPDLYAPRLPAFRDVNEWLDLPIAKAPLDRVGAGSALHMLKEVDIAARCVYCDWQMLPRLREDGPMMLIPDMASFRSMSVLLALRSRLEMRDRKLDRAVYSFQTGLGMSRHLADSPTLMSYLIGVDCATQTLNRVEEFVQQSNAPNLYWALTDLPRPLIDMRRPLQGERVIIDQVYPNIRGALANPNAPPIAPQTLRAILAKLAALGILKNRFVSAVSAATTYPRARGYLLDHGWSPEQVAALPVTQVALMYTVAQHEKWTEEFYKLNNLPYWQAQPRVNELRKRLYAAAEKDQRWGLGSISSLVFIPNISYAAQARLQRQIELLRCVEAIRMHAAAHDGALPASLDDIRAVPIPDDPFTGKAFRYTKDAGRAIIEAPAPPGEQAGDQNSVRIELAIAAKK